MKCSGWVAVCVGTLVLGQPCAWATVPRPFQLDRLNSHLQGKVIDYTRNHGADRRIWSAALHEKRDMYVYLPPGYDPCKRYPLAIYLHGFRQDETSFIEYVARSLDRAILAGILPPLVIAAPDGSVHGVSCVVTAGTFFINSNLGAFEDYLLKDVYPFILQHYSIRPEPEAHAFLGVSMGGMAAVAKVLKYPQCFKVAATVFPPLNLRWLSCRHRYMDNFDPDCWDWREDFSNGHDVIGRFFGVITVRLRSVVHPLYGRNNPDTTALVSSENPIELLDSRDIKPGEVELYISYGGRDQFNLDAQIESFLYRARQRGLDIAVGYDPKGTHSARTAMKLLPGLVEWLNVKLLPYAPK